MSDAKAVLQDTISEALNWRYAAKRFDPEKIIPTEQWDLLKKSLVLSPSSYGIQPWQFLVIENKAIREQLKPVSWNQSQVTDASHYVVFTYKKEVDEKFVDQFIHRVADVREVPVPTLEGFRQMLMQNLAGAPQERIEIWSQRQAYIAMGFLLETAALLGIDATPMEGFDPAAYDKILKLEGTGYKSVASVALGYRHVDDSFQNLKKVRFQDEQVIKIIR